MSTKVEYSKITYLPNISWYVFNNCENRDCYWFVKMGGDIKNKEIIKKVLNEDIFIL